MIHVSFASDYMDGCHPAVAEQLLEACAHSHRGYGTDSVCERARGKIRTACAAPDAGVHFLVGGTQANMVTLDALVRPWEGIVAATTGHIACHEAGAVERSGHKVIELPPSEGKISAAQVRALAEAWEADESREHVVQPGVVYLSQPTEVGTLYTRRELTEMREACDDHGMRLYVDGARLAYALACPENDVSLADLARLTDAFYIGGTKCGTLLGEAVVLPDPSIAPRFFTMTKQHGAMPAKGFVLGAQFDALFSDNAYLKIGKPAMDAAVKIRKLMESHGVTEAYRSPTNQLFYELPTDKAKALAERVGYTTWEQRESTTVIRLVTCWASTDNDVKRLAEALDEVL